MLQYFFLLLTIGSHSLALENPCSNGQGVIVHLFEWSWNAIAEECEEVLGPLGYCGVQISPPNEHILGSEWWTRYQPVSYRLESSSGSESEFKSMVSRCKKAGVSIIVDLVINHMSSDSQGLGTAGSSYDGKEQRYPDFSPGDFHQPRCEVDNYADKFNVRNCYLVGLNDLNGGSEYVRSKVAQYMNRLLELGVGGFRVDAAKHMWVEDLKAIQDRISYKFNDTSYFFEVIYGDGEAIQPEEYVTLGKVTEFRASSWISCIASGGLECLNGYGENMLPSGEAFVSVDNHDNQRGHGGENNVITHTKPHLYKMASGFLLGHSYGQKRVMSSYYFYNSDQGPPASNPRDCNGWVCEHRWPEISNMVKFANGVGQAEVKHYQHKGGVLGFARGEIGFVAVGNLSKRTEFFTGLPDGTYCDLISGCDWKVTVTNGFGSVFKGDRRSPVLAICVNNCEN